MAGTIKKSAMVMDLEATNGTAVNPTAAANAVAIRVRNLKFKPTVKMAGRDVITGAMGNDDKLPFSQTLDGGTFDTELAGSGTAGTAPAWGKTMQMGGFAETVVAGSRVEYTPAASGFKSSTIFVQQFGVRLEKYYYVMAALKLDFKVGDIPGLSATCKGLVTSVAAGTLGAVPTLTAWQRSLAVGQVNTSKVNLGTGVTYAAGVIAGGAQFDFNSYTLDCGQDVQLLELASRQTIDIYDFKPKVELIVDLTAAQHAQMIADMRSGITYGLGFTHGTAAGKKVVIYHPRCVIVDMDDQSIGPIYISKITLEPRDSVDGLGDWVRITAA
jgi:hypothetical protein